MKRARKAATTYPTRGQVRVATGLTADEKLLIYTVASHENEVSWGSREVLKGWSGLSERRFRRARAGALAKGVLVEAKRPGHSTVYRIGGRALGRLATEGVRASEERKTPETGVRSVFEGLTTVDGAFDHSEHDGTDQGDPDSPDQGGHQKENKKTNSEEVKNKKAQRRVRVPRSNQTRSPTASEETAHKRQETMDEKKASVRTRVTAYNSRREGT